METLSEYGGRANDEISEKYFTQSRELIGAFPTLGKLYQGSLFDWITLDETSYHRLHVNNCLFPVHPWLHYSSVWHAHTPLVIHR